MAETIAPILAGGLVGLVSLLLGRWLEQRSSQAAWLRTERMKAYLALIRASYDAWRAFEATYVRQRKREPCEPQWAAFEHAVVALSHAREEVALVGPDDVSQAASDVARSLYEMSDLVRSADAVAAAREVRGKLVAWPEVVAYQRLHDSFVASAQDVIRARR